MIKSTTKTIILTLILSLPLFSCTSNTKRIIQDLPDEKILVLSGYPDTYYVNVIGTTMFSNHNSQFENLDINVNNSILSFFTKKEFSGKYILDQEQPNFEFTKGNWYTGFGFNIKHYIPELKRLKSKFNVRYIILIGPERSYDSIFDTNQFYNGFGITRRYIFSQPKTVLYTTMKLALLDTSNFKIIKSINTLQHEYTNKLQTEKIHKLDRKDFLIFKENYNELFQKAVDSLIGRL